MTITRFQWSYYICSLTLQQSFAAEFVIWVKWLGAGQSSWSLAMDQAVWAIVPAASMRMDLPAAAGFQAVYFGVKQGTFWAFGNPAGWMGMDMLAAACIYCLLGMGRFHGPSPPNTQSPHRLATHRGSAWPSKTRNTEQTHPLTFPLPTRSPVTVVYVFLSNTDINIRSYCRNCQV